MVYLWKASVKRSSGNLAVGMSVEIPIKDNTRKPGLDELANAFNAKYGPKTASPSTISNFITIEKM